MKVHIYCGIPGAGKTTLIKLRHPTVPRDYIFSADHEFEKPDGSYVYVREKQGEAHHICLRRFIRTAKGEFAHHTADLDLVVDNSNTTIAEIAPYVAIGQAYGHEVKITTVDCDPVLAASRNVHGVSAEIVEKMYKQLHSRIFPPWWKHETVHFGNFDAERGMFLPRKDPTPIPATEE
jgi:hypothetical protein